MSFACTNPRLHIDAAASRVLEHASRSSYPDEACGLLIGRASASGVDVLAAIPAANIAAESRTSHFEIDPGAIVAADEKAASLGLELVGTWHSHPDSTATPSRSDRAAAWRGMALVIIAMQRGEPSDVRAWSLAGETYRELELASKSSAGVLH